MEYEAVGYGPEIEKLWWTLLWFINIESLGAEHFLGWLQSIVNHLKFNVNFGTYTFLGSSYVLSDF